MASRSVWASNRFSTVTEMVLAPNPLRGRPRLRADFVAHLIATADRAPQTRTLRRATPADAQAAYQAQQRTIPAAGIRTRQII